MKNTIKILGLAVVIAAISFSMTACEEPKDPTPRVGDYEFGNLLQVEGSVTAVTVTPRYGGIPAASAIYYDGETDVPQEAGEYAVTFDVAKVKGYQAASGLSAGTLVVEKIPNPFTSIASLATWLASHPDNTADNPYNIKLDVGSLGGDSGTAGSLGKALRDNTTKYVKLDLSDSTFTSIESSAFNPYSNADGGTSIEINLVEIIIPGTVTSIGNSAFTNCSKLVKVNIPDGVTRIEEKTFSGCTGLTGIKIPDGVTYIGSQAFASSGLTSVTIPANVITVTAGAFSGCANLTEIIVVDGNERYISVEGVLYLTYNSEKVLAQYPLGKTGATFEIPSDVTIIGGNAFSECKFTSMTIPNTITQIEGSAFAYSSLTSIEIPVSVTSIGMSAFSYCESLAEAKIGGGIIGAQAFDQCNNLVTVNLGNVTRINQYAFYGCEKLASITIPSSVTNIYQYAFFGTNLVSVTFEEPDSTLTLGTGTTNIVPAFAYNLDAVYKASTGGAGTYTRERNANNTYTWTKSAEEEEEEG